MGVLAHLASPFGHLHLVWPTEKDQLNGDGWRPLTPTVIGDRVNLGG